MCKVDGNRMKQKETLSLQRGTKPSSLSSVGSAPWLVFIELRSGHEGRGTRDTVVCGFMSPIHVLSRIL